MIRQYMHRIGLVYCLGCSSGAPNHCKAALVSKPYPEVYHPTVRCSRFLNLFSPVRWINTFVPGISIEWLITCDCRLCFAPAVHPLVVNANADRNVNVVGVVFGMPLSIFAFFHVLKAMLAVETQLVCTFVSFFWATLLNKIVLGLTQCAHATSWSDFGHKMFYITGFAEIAIPPTLFRLHSLLYYKCIE